MVCSAWLAGQQGIMYMLLDAAGWSQQQQWYAPCQQSGPGTSHALQVPELSASLRHAACSQGISCWGLCLTSTLGSSHRQHGLHDLLADSFAHGAACLQAYVQ